MEFSEEDSPEDERRLKQNLATRIMSNGVGVVVKDHDSSASNNFMKILSSNLNPTTVRNKQKLTLDSGEQRKKMKTFSSLLHQPDHSPSNTSSNKALVSSSKATILNHQHKTASFPLQQFMQHNYIIKTCLTTYTYLTTVIQNKKSAVSTFETVISVVTTESLTNMFRTNLFADIRPTKTKYMEVKTIQPTAHRDNSEYSDLVKLEKRIDNRYEDDLDSSYELIQPSEVSHNAPCTTKSCPCSHFKTESIDKVKTKNTNSLKYKKDATVVAPFKRISIKSTQLDSSKIELLTPTLKQSTDQNTMYGPYKYETTKLPPSDKVVEKYTEVINDYSDEKDTSSVEASELLTNEEAPPSKNEKGNVNRKPEKTKEKPHKPNKTKFVVADLLKLGSLGIKGLSQLAPVIEKMTGGFIKRQDTNTNSTSTVKPAINLTPYNVNKRVDSSEVDKKIEEKPTNFPIYIPVDELETSESQHIYSNATLHQSLAWGADRKHPKAHFDFSKLVHESPLVNGGIPISPGEIITANSDVIVGKPAVGGPLTLTASGIKLKGGNKHTSFDSQSSSNEPFLVNERPPKPNQPSPMPKNDDSYDLRPPELPNLRPRQPMKDPQKRPGLPQLVHPGSNQQHQINQYHGSRFPTQNDQRHPSPQNEHRIPISSNEKRQPPPRNDNRNPLLQFDPPAKYDQGTLGQLTLQPSNTFFDHGRPALMDYIPTISKQNDQEVHHTENHESYNRENDDSEAAADSHPSSSEIINKNVRNDGDYSISSQSFSESINKPFLVDIQPSRVANVIIPHGSSTALIFAGSSEPHKTGDYIDDPLPYPEPGYFGSFSIDAPQMTMVHNVAPTPNVNDFNLKSRKPFQSDSNQSHSSPHKTISGPNNDYKLKPNINNKRPTIDFNKIPPPTSNQETHIQVGPHIASYNPDVFNPSTQDFEKYNHLKGSSNRFSDSKKVIDKEYENHLAVPPPPPPKGHFSVDTNAGNNQDTLKNTRPYNQRPIFHTKPIQDMKVFLNVQHPIPKQPVALHPNQETPPPKITSEIYFAAASPQNYPKIPAYTVHLPATTMKTQLNNQGQDYENFNLNIRSQSTSSFQPYQNDFNVVTPKQSVTKSELLSPNIFNDNNNFYAVTLNTATNIGNANVNSDKIHGTSIAVPVGTSSNNFTDLDSTGIPVGTNIAIKVDGDPVSFQNFNFNAQKNPPMIYDEHGQAPDIIIGDNKWNYSPNHNTEYESQTENRVTFNETLNAPKFHIKKDSQLPQNTNIQTKLNDSFHNSHANFPMIHDTATKAPIQDSAIKPVIEDVEDVVIINQKRPSKLIPNIPTNSHGWYSSIPIHNMNMNTFGNVNKIKVDSTTRKIIPLSHAYGTDSIPEFGEKIPSVGLPPTNLWNQNNVPVLQGKDQQKFNVPPKDNVKPSSFMGPPPLTTQPYNPAYIPSNFGVSKQPAYDIPTHNDETYEFDTKKHTKQPHTSGNVKPVYENSEEVYDGGSDENITDGEVSLESMKIPVVSTANEKKHQRNTTPLTLLQDEVFDSSEEYEKSQITVSNTNTGTQTEKPFLGGEYNHNQTPSQFSTQKPVYSSNSHMKPRPFEVNSHTPSFSDAPNPHWQINQLLENVTIPEDNSNLILNIGEEMSRPITKKPIAFTTKTHHTTQEMSKKPSRPIFSLKNNNTKTRNESSSIITSTVHLSDFKPLTVYNDSKDTSSTLPSFTIGATYLEANMTDIVNLSPPPPTMDYNFKPSSTDETIMGMSPPPQRTPIVPRVPPIRTPAPPRMPPTRPTIPPRTPPSYKNKPVRTLPSRTQPPRTAPSRNSPQEQVKDEISTYRPSYDILKNKLKRPFFNRDNLPSHLMPPPTEISSQFMPELSVLPAQDVGASSMSNIAFPTLISSGWLTSSSLDFPAEYSPSSVQFSFAPTSVYENSVVDKLVTHKPLNEQTPVLIPDEHKVIPLRLNISNEATTIKTPTSKNQEDTYNSDASSTTASDSVAHESNISQEEITSSEETKVVPLDKINEVSHKKNDDSKQTPPKVKLPIKPSIIIRPTRTLSRSDNLYPTKVLPSRKRPSNFYSPSSRIPSVYRPSIIESSESPIEDDYLSPTEVLKDIVSSSSVSEKVIPLVEKTVLRAPSKIIEVVSVMPTHHAGNEVKISDEIIPTKTEFKTTAITLTKTLSEPPKTVSTTRFLNLTHTLTVTHTKTSLVSQSAGAMTQTLILTNTHFSTIVDVVTEIHTQVQPTTIVETVTKHIPIIQPTSVHEKPLKTKISALDDISISSEEDNFIINPGNETENIQKVDKDEESDTFLIVMNKSQNGGTSQPVPTDIETSDYDGVTRNEEVNSNGVSQVLFGEILLAGTPYLETTNVVKPTGTGFSKECQPDCKASRNERCQRIDGIMKCVCRPGFARMFPDRPCKPTYTYSVKLALSHQGKARLNYHPNLANNASKEYHSLALATHEGIDRMVMQSDLRDVFHGIHINGFHPVEVPAYGGDKYTGADFYVQLSDNAHETRLKEVIEKYLRTNNYSLGGTDVYAAGELVDKLDVSDFDECLSVQFHDCSEHSQCFNLRGTYTCSCMEGFADMSVNALYPGRICSAEQVGCERCNYHGACYTRDDKRVLCECFQWYAGASCHINLKVILISLTTVGAALVLVLVVCGVMACSRRPRPAHPHPPPRSIVTSCIQNMPSLHQGAIPISKHRGTHDRRALINERTDSGDASSVQNMSLPYMPSKKVSATSSKGGKKCSIPDPPSEKAPAPCVMIPRARLHQGARDGRDAATRKPSMELSSEAKLISYLESGSNSNDEMMRRKHSAESSYSLNKERHSKHNTAGALISAGFKVSTTVKPDDSICKDDDMSSINKTELLDGNLSHFDTLRKTYSQDDISEWTDAERRIGELTLSEARSVGGTLPASTGRAASSARLTHQGSDVSEFDSL